MVRHLGNTTRVIAIVALLSPLTGCSAFRNTVPGYCVGDGYQESRSDKEPINFLRLRREPPAAYRLDSRDVLGIYIEGVLGNKDEPPPVHFPEQGEDMPPAIGYPVPVREDGTVSLPLITPLNLKGLTLAGAEQKIRDAYIGKKILKPDRERIIVTLMRPRTYHVLVVREDSTALGANQNFNFAGNPRNLALQMALGQTKAGQSYPVELRAYENDVLHALSETGGLPGSDARNEVIILRGAFSTTEERDFYMNSLNDPEQFEQIVSRPNVIKIPLRIGPDDPVIQLSEEDITLNTGDIVFVRTRETEVFYTGGLLPAGQWPIPRDYDIDVLQAIALAGGNVSAAVGTADDGLLRSGGIGAIFAPTRLIVLRELCGEQVPIEIDLRRAMVDPGERIRVLPGDFITLEYTPLELVGNVALGLLRFNVFLGNR
jgi:protein involved in polysaccharide export with SLBB domain